MATRYAIVIGVAALAASGTAQAQWAPLPSPTSDTLRALHFLDDRNGWVAGYNGVVRRTGDGGASWTPQVSGTNVRLLAVRFVDPNTGWINGGAYVARTTNGGGDWIPLTIDLTPLIFRNNGFPTSATTYWVPAACGSCNPSIRWFYRYTLDGSGATNEEFFDLVASSAALFDLHFIGADNGWAVGASGLIRRITNASSATPGFAAQTSTTSNTLNGVFMLDATTGWIVGNAGTIRATTNGGANWSPQTSSTGANLRDVHFRDALNGWIVGDAGTILSTTNGGATWVPENSTVVTSLFGVQALASNVYAVGGDLATSTNGVALKRSDLVFSNGFEDP